jgi:hypothetical protein
MLSTRLPLSAVASNIALAEGTTLCGSNIQIWPVTWVFVVGCGMLGRPFSGRDSVFVDEAAQDGGAADRRVGGGATAGVGGSGLGGRWRSDRCGRWVLKYVSYSAKGTEHASFRIVGETPFERWGLRAHEELRDAFPEVPVRFVTELLDEIVYLRGPGVQQ